MEPKQIGKQREAKMQREVKTWLLFDKGLNNQVKVFIKVMLFPKPKVEGEYVWNWVKANKYFKSPKLISGYIPEVLWLVCYSKRELSCCVTL
jgi:hypothetical protein